MRLEFREISGKYDIKEMRDEDVSDVYRLCMGNPAFYRYGKSDLTMEYIRQDFNALPPGKESDDQYYMGFYKENKLIAVMNLIVGYPNRETCYIGFFMMKKEFQGSGIGTEIIKELLLFLKKEGFVYAKLGCIKENAEGMGFWRKNMFLPAGAETETAKCTIIAMEREL